MGRIRFRVPNSQVCTDQSLDAAGLGLFVELDQRKQVSLIRECYRRHVHACHRIYELRYTDNAVHQRILAVQAQVNETR